MTNGKKLVLQEADLRNCSQQQKTVDELQLSEMTVQFGNSQPASLEPWPGKVRRLKELATLESTTNCNEDFGGFTIVAMGDFRQIPPVRSKSLLDESMHPTPNASSPDALGGCLWRKFQLLMFTEQMRAQEPIQCARVATLRGGHITKELLDSIKFLDDEDIQSKEWRDPTFLVGTNEERHALNFVLGVRFAQMRGVPFVRWHNPIGGIIAHNAPQPLIDALYEYIPDLTGAFIQDAPAMVLNNFSPQCGLANGSLCTLVSLGEICEEDTEKIKKAQPGEVVWLTKPPSHIIVSVKALDANPIIPHIKVKATCGVPVKLCPDSADLPKIITDTKSRSLSFMWHYIALGFCYTFHKCQGKTLQKVVLCLDQPKSRRLLFEQVLVGMTRVKRATDLRILHPLQFSKQDTWKKLCDLQPARFFDEWFEKKNFVSGKMEGIRLYDTIDVSENTRNRLRKLPKTNTCNSKQCQTRSDPIVIKDEFATDAQQKQHGTGKTATPSVIEVDALPDEEQKQDDAGKTARELMIVRREVIRSIQQKYAFLYAEVIDVVMFGVAKEFKSNTQPISGLEWHKLPSLQKRFKKNSRYTSWLSFSSHFIPVCIDTKNMAIIFADSLELANLERHILRNLQKHAENCTRKKMALQQCPLCELQTENECGIFTLNKCVEWMDLQASFVTFDRTNLTNAFLRYAPTIAQVAAPVVQPHATEV